MTTCGCQSRRISDNHHRVQVYLKQILLIKEGRKDIICLKTVFEHYTSVHDLRTLILLLLCVLDKNIS